MREGEGECGVGAGYLPDELGYAGQAAGEVRLVQQRCSTALFSDGSPVRNAVWKRGNRLNHPTAQHTLGEQLPNVARLPVRCSL